MAGLTDPSGRWPEVVVDGWGRLAGETVAQLRRLGVAVRAGAHAADAAELEVAAGAPPPAAVVLVAEGAPPAWRATPSLAAPWHAHGVPHLPVVAAAGVAVGPLVVPGRTACLRCVSPPGWGPVDSAGAGPAGDATVVLGAAVTSVTALAVLRGDLTLGGISTEIDGHGTSVVHRVWASRPGCRCASVTMAG